MERTSNPNRLTQSRYSASATPRLALAFQELGSAATAGFFCRSFACYTKRLSGKSAGVFGSLKPNAQARNPLSALFDAHSSLARRASMTICGQEYSGYPLSIFPPSSLYLGVLLCYTPIISLLVSVVAAAGPTENLLVNGDFEQGVTGWHELWTRTPGGKLFVERQEPHGGTAAARIEYSGQQDWSLNRRNLWRSSPDRFTSSTAGSASRGRAIRRFASRFWTQAARPSTGPMLARHPRPPTNGACYDRDSWFPPAHATIQARLIGYGPATVLFDDARLVLEGSFDEMRSKNLPATLSVVGKFLEIEFHTADGTLTVKDRRSGYRWEQWARTPVVVLDAKTTKGGLDVTLLDPATMLRLEPRFASTRSGRRSPYRSAPRARCLTPWLIRNPSRPTRTRCSFCR